MSDTSVEFWCNECNWPRDSSKFVFLARVVQMIGNRLFPGQWTGLEPEIKLLPKPEVDDSDLIPVYLRDLVDPYVYYEANFFGGSFSAQERAKALTLVARANAEKRPGLTRFKAVKQRIISLAQQGELVTALQAFEGGEFSELPSLYWNAANLERRFALCQMDKPFDSVARSESLCWIFVSKASLERSINSLRSIDSQRPINSPKKSGGAKRGRAEKYDWEEGKLYLHKLLEQNGDFKDAANKVEGWRSQNDAVSLLIEHLAKISKNDGPSPSGVKAKVREWLEEFRSGQ
jgi:hypothetical protein